MTDNRQAALAAAIDVWSVETDGDVFMRPDVDHILRLADKFLVWLNGSAVSLTLTPGNIRPVNTP